VVAIDRPPAMSSRLSPGRLRTVVALIPVAGARARDSHHRSTHEESAVCLAGLPLRRAPMVAGCPRLLFKEKTMTVARITEISSVSPKSFEDAIVQGVERANKTLKNVKGAWVKDQEVTIDGGKISGYKVILKVTFVLTD
jgi:flavin-binding protein dodecin